MTHPITNPWQAHAIVQRGMQNEPFTNVNGENALPFLHCEPVALREAWNKFDDIAARCGKDAVFVRLEYAAYKADDVGKAAKWLPRIMDKLNNNRRWRRVGVSGARLANVYKRGGSCLYVSDNVFADWYAAAVVAHMLVWKALPWPKNQRIVVQLKRGAFGRRSMHDATRQFMVSFWERSKYSRSRWTLDPLGNWSVLLTPNDAGVNMGVLALLLDTLGKQIEEINIGQSVTISRDNTVYESDYMESISKMYRNFRFKYLQPFGAFSPFFKSK